MELVGKDGPSKCIHDYQDVRSDKGYLDAAIWRTAADRKAHIGRRKHVYLQHQFRCGGTFLCR